MTEDRYRPRGAPLKPQPRRAPLLDANGNPIVPQGYRKPGQQAVNLDEFEAMGYTTIEDGSPAHVVYGRQVVQTRLYGELGKSVRGPVGFIEAGPDKRDTLMLRMIFDETEQSRIRQFFTDHPFGWLIVGTCRAAR